MTMEGFMMGNVCLILFTQVLDAILEQILNTVYASVATFEDLQIELLLCLSLIN